MSKRAVEKQRNSLVDQLQTRQNTDYTLSKDDSIIQTWSNEPLVSWIFFSGLLQWTQNSSYKKKLSQNSRHSICTQKEYQIKVKLIEEDGIKRNDSEIGTILSFIQKKQQEIEIALKFKTELAIFDKVNAKFIYTIKRKKSQNQISKAQKLVHLIKQQAEGNQQTFKISLPKYQQRGIFYNQKISIQFQLIKYPIRIEALSQIYLKSALQYLNSTFQILYFIMPIRQRILFYEGKDSFISALQTVFKYFSGIISSQQKMTKQLIEKFETQSLCTPLNPTNIDAFIKQCIKRLRQGITSFNQLWEVKRRQNQDTSIAFKDLFGSQQDRVIDLQVKTDGVYQGSLQECLRSTYSKTQKYLKLPDILFLNMKQGKQINKIQYQNSLNLDFLSHNKQQSQYLLYAIIIENGNPHTQPQPQRHMFQLPISSGYHFCQSILLIFYIYQLSSFLMDMNKYSDFIHLQTILLIQILRTVANNLSSNDRYYSDKGANIFSRDLYGRAPAYLNTRYRMSKSSIETVLSFDGQPHQGITLDRASGQLKRINRYKRGKLSQLIYIKKASFNKIQARNPQNQNHIKLNLSDQEQKALVSYMLLVYIRQFKDEHYSNSSMSIRERITGINQQIKKFMFDKISQANKNYYFSSFDDLGIQQKNICFVLKGFELEYGAQYSKNIFKQQRIESSHIEYRQSQKSINEKQKTILNPTRTTRDIINRIQKPGNYVISGQKGCGKTFSILIYNYLASFILKARVNPLNINQPNPLAHTIFWNLFTCNGTRKDCFAGVKKVFYITLTNQLQINWRSLLQNFRIQAAEEFKENNVEQMQQQLGQISQLQFTESIRRIIKKYNQYSINSVVIVDQINRYYTNIRKYQDAKRINSDLPSEKSKCNHFYQQLSRQSQIILAVIQPFHQFFMNASQGIQQDYFIDSKQVNGVFHPDNYIRKIAKQHLKYTQFSMSHLGQIQLYSVFWFEISQVLVYFDLRYNHIRVIRFIFQLFYNLKDNFKDVKMWFTNICNLGIRVAIRKCLQDSSLIKCFEIIRNSWLGQFDDNLYLKAAVQNLKQNYQQAGKNFEIKQEIFKMENGSGAEYLVNIIINIFQFFQGKIKQDHSISKIKTKCKKGLIVNKFARQVFQIDEKYLQK